MVGIKNCVRDLFSITMPDRQLAFVNSVPKPGGDFCKTVFDFHIYSVSRF